MSNFTYDQKRKATAVFIFIERLPSNISSLLVKKEENLFGFKSDLDTHDSQESHDKEEPEEDYP